MTRPVVPEDLYKLTLVSNPRLARDASRVAFVVTRLRKDDYSSSIWAGDSGGVRPITSGGRDYCPAWSPDSEAIAFVRGERGGPSKLMMVNASGGEPWIVAELEYSVGWLEWSPTGDYLVAAGRRRPEKKYEERDYLDIRRVTLWYNGEGWVYDRPSVVYKISYPSGGVERISPEGVDSYLPAVSPDGRFIAYARSPSELEPYKGEVAVYDVETGDERVIESGMTVSGIAWSRDGVYLAVRGHFWERGNATHHKIYVYNVETGEKECLSCMLPYNTLNTVNSDVRGPSCARNLEWDENGWVYFQVHERGRVHVYRARPGGEPVPFLEAGHGVIDEFTLGGNEPIIAYTYMTPTEPKELYMGTRDNRVRVTGFNDWLRRERDLAEPVEFVVGEGQSAIDAWILPPSETGDCSKCVPWVLYIHGGPKTSFGYGFMFEFHVLSGAGYAVVYSNPHGSDGYDEEFADIRGRLGTIDYEDLMNVADEATSHYDYLDPERGAVAGGSYGGWMTNYIITRTTRFRAAVTMRSCSDWSSFYGASDIGWYFAREILEAEPWASPEAYVEKSPLFHLDKARAPTLIIHSTADYRCPLDQAITLYRGLRVNGVEARLALFPGENHDLMRNGMPRRRIARLKLILEWLHSKLGGNRVGLGHPPHGPQQGG